MREDGCRRSLLPKSCFAFAPWRLSINASGASIEYDKSTSKAKVKKSQRQIKHYRRIKRVKQTRQMQNEQRGEGKLDTVSRVGLLALRLVKHCQNMPVVLNDAPIL